MPKGAYNVITGSGAQIGMALAEHPGIAMLTFTGSPEVGRTIKSRAGFKKVTLELGNNSAVIVEPGSDMDTAVSRTVQGAFAHSGQVCISVQRAFVHRTHCGRVRGAAEDGGRGSPDRPSLRDLDRYFLADRRGGSHPHREVDRRSGRGRRQGGDRRPAHPRDRQPGRSAGRAGGVPHLLPGGLRAGGGRLPLRRIWRAPSSRPTRRRTDCRPASSPPTCSAPSRPRASWKWAE